MDSKRRRRRFLGTRSVYMTETMKSDVDVWEYVDEDEVDRRILSNRLDPSKYDVAPSGRLIAGSKRVARSLTNSSATPAPESSAQLNEQVAPAPVDEEMTMDCDNAQNAEMKA
ncbi:hypothetical protein Hypma_016496 [Hypsizygus marmoreus]|uniref:Uncharacterized protein n=1 Tax=Hypsizygus marmoreus TaxID=39966 RepID=A0A369IZT9_HYPMA|nr:hypothetical protein Hypma_016496 [Hypsizygus marmoreus]